MNNLEKYFILRVLDLILLSISLKCLVLSFILGSYVGVILWSLIFACDADFFLNRHRDFVRYYPNFEDKWLKIF